jgi:hypothetical protein
MRYLLTLSLLATTSLAISAQEKRKDQGPVPVVDLKRKSPVIYQKEVEPIFYKKCIACHSGKDPESKFDLSTYEGLIKGGKRGSPVVPGKGGDSLLYKLMTRVDTKVPMPPRGEPPIVAAEMALIKLWIDQGAKAP